MPLVWVAMVARTSNLRLWTRTLLVGTILTLLHAVVAWTTVVPDPAGWVTCQARLDAGLLHQARGQAGFLEFVGAFFNLVWLWLASMLNGNHMSQSLVCSDAVMSGSTCFSSLFAFGLYDVARMTTRKMKPHFRRLYRMFFGAILTAVVVAASLAEVAHHRQYSSNVVLSFIFTLLLYGSPAVGICVDRWLTTG